MSYTNSPSKRGFPSVRGGKETLQKTPQTRESAEHYMSTGFQSIPGTTIPAPNQIPTGYSIPTGQPVNMPSSMNPMMMSANQAVRAQVQPQLQGIQTASALGRYGGANQLNLSGMGASNMGIHQDISMSMTSSRATPPLTSPRGPHMVPNGLRTSTGTPQPQHGLSGNFTPEMINMFQQSKATNYGMGSYPQAPLSSFLPSGSVMKQTSSSGEFPFIPARGGPGMGKTDPEFNPEDFPALPGYKGPTNVTSADVNSNGPTTIPPPVAHYQFTKAPSFENINPTAIRASQPSPGMSYEQFLARSSPHIMQSQQQPQQTPPTPQPSATQQPQLKTQKPFVPDRFGLLGLLNVIRMSDADLNILALGTDLTTLGLNLNSADSLYNTFASPWADAPSRREPEFFIPSCYTMQTPLQTPMAKMKDFSEETLFYIFYSTPRDVLQIAAAAELYRREWRFHKEHRVWLTPASRDETTKANGVERGAFIFFDSSTWDKVRKENVTISLDQLEPQPLLKV